MKGLFGFFLAVSCCISISSASAQPVYAAGTTITVEACEAFCWNEYQECILQSDYSEESRTACDDANTECLIGCKPSRLQEAGPPFGGFQPSRNKEAGGFDTPLEPRPLTPKPPSRLMESANYDAQLYRNNWLDFWFFP